MPQDVDKYRPNLDNGRQGWIYVLSSPVLRDEQGRSLYKVGATRKHPLQRAKELSAGTGVPTQFSVAYYRDFADCFAAETLIHETFASDRVDDKREFFALDIGELIDYIDGLGTSADYKELESQGLVGGEMREWRPAKTVATPFAELFASFPDDGSPRELTPDERAQCEALRRNL